MRLRSHASTTDYPQCRPAATTTSAETLAQPTPPTRWVRWSLSRSGRALAASVHALAIAGAGVAPHVATVDERLVELR